MARKRLLLFSCVTNAEDDLDHVEWPPDLESYESECGQLTP